jgi:hypothetical protein
MCIENQKKITTSNECFFCRKHAKGFIVKEGGWHHRCGEGLENIGLKDIEKCPKYAPNVGFQIGGYYSHMYFDPEGPGYERDSYSGNPCMTWTMESDGMFPTDDPARMLKFHICDFEQIEEFVEFWGKYLRAKGIIAPREPTTET